MERREKQQDDKSQTLPPRQQDAQTPLPRKRRWLRIVLLVAVLLGVLVFIAPYLISTDWGTAAVVSVANSQLKGQLVITDLSLGWGGPTSVVGLEVIDEQGRQVVNVPRIEWAGGVWRGVTSPMEFARVVADSPSILLYVEPDGGVSLAEALSSRHPRPKKKDKPLPELIGQVALVDGRAEVVMPDGATMKIPRFAGQVDLNTLSRISGHFELETPDGGLVSADVDLDQLVTEKKLSLDHATGTVTVRTEEPVEIAPILLAATGEQGAAGRVTLNAQLTLRDGQIQAEYDSQVQGLRTAGEGLQPIDIATTARARTEDQRLVAHAEVTGQPGQFVADMSLPLGGGQAWPSAEALTNAALHGGDVSLPALELDATGEVDLPRLAQAVPAMLNIRRDVQLTAGKLTIEKMSLRGGVQPSAEGRIALSELAATRGGQPVRVSPISAAWVAMLDRSAGLVVERLAFESSFARMTGQGTMENMTADLDADLAEAHRELAQVFDMGQSAMAGTLTGKFSLKQSQEDQLDIHSTAQVSGLRVDRDGEPQVAVEAATFEQNSQLLLEDGKPAEAVLAGATLKVDQALTLNASGRYDLRDGAADFRAEGSLSDLAAVGRWVPAPQAKLRRYGGSVKLAATANRAGAEAPIISEGEVSAAGLTADGKPLGDGTARLAWSEVKIGPEDGQLALAAVTFDGLGASASAEQFKADLAGQQPAVDGRLTARANLASLTAALAAVSQRETPPAVAGTLNWQGNFATQGRTVRLDGGGQVDDLAVGHGERVYREKQLVFKHQASLDGERNRIDVKEVSLESRPLRARAAGTINDYRDQMILDLKGHYEGSWDDIFVLVDELAPDTSKTIMLAGKTESDFTVTGPARQPEIRPTYHGVDAGTNVSWASGTMEGLELGSATLQPVMKGGQITLPLTEVAASQGVMRLGGVVDLRQTDPVYRLADRVDVLENVQINRQFARDVMSRVNPIFADLVSIEGTVSLMLQDMDLPLGEAIKTTGRGQGRLDLSKMKVQPSGILAELLKLGSAGSGGASEMSLSPVDFVIRDGRVQYDNFVMNVGDYDLRFHGSVGFDNTVDLICSVPLRPGMLQKLGVGGLSSPYVGLLEGLRVDIPIVGSRLSPRLDFSKVDIGAITKHLRERLLKQGAGSVLEDLLKGGGVGKQPDSPQTPAEPQAPPQQPRRRPSQLPSPQQPEQAPEQPASQPGLQLLDELLDRIDRSGRQEPK